MTKHALSCPSICQRMGDEHLSQIHFQNFQLFQNYPRLLFKKFQKFRNFQNSARYGLLPRANPHSPAEKGGLLWSPKTKPPFSSRKGGFALEGFPNQNTTSNIATFQNFQYSSPYFSKNSKISKKIQQFQKTRISNNSKHSETSKMF